MKYRTCGEAFLEGDATRRTYPLHSGLYKLVESKARIEGTAREIIRISEVVTNQRNAFSLMHCTFEDKAFWLREAPLNVAYRMGYEIIPSFSALVGDGVGSIEAESAARAVESEMVHKLLYWDQLRNSYNRRIANEYERMRNGHSNALRVVDEALDLIDLGVNQLPATFQAEYEKWVSTQGLL